MSTTHESPVLVIGGTGKSGRRVAARLDALGIPTRIVSRTTPVPFDWNDTSTWDAAIDGVSAAYVAYAPDIAFPGAPEQIAELGRRLAARGVRRVVLLSGRGEEGSRAAERAMLEAIPTASVVSCAFFTQNFTEGVFTEDVLAGQLALPVPPDVPEPFVDLDDVADVAVAALRDDAYAGRVLELTGPQALTFGEAAAAVGEALGRPAAFQAISVEEFVAAVVASGEPAEVGYGLAEVFAQVMDGRNVSPTGAVAEVLGRQATTIAQAAQRELARD